MRLRLGAVSRFEHYEAFRLEASAQQGADLRLVVDDENVAGR